MKEIARIKQRKPENGLQHILYHTIIRGKLGSFVLYVFTSIFGQSLGIQTRHQFNERSTRSPDARRCFYSLILFIHRTMCSYLYACAVNGFAHVSRVVTLQRTNNNSTTIIFEVYEQVSERGFAGEFQQIVNIVKTIYSLREFLPCIQQSTNVTATFLTGKRKKIG